MQLLAKFKKFLYMEFRATLKFRKFKVALNPMYIIFLNFAKSCVLSCLLRRLEIVFIFPRLVLQILFQIQFGLSYQCEIYHRHK